MLCIITVYIYIHLRMSPIAKEIETCTFDKLIIIKTTVILIPKHCSNVITLT